eukprot:3372175-Ditylum_brightwellii.AAC.1
MVHPNNCAGTDGTMLLHGVGNSVDIGDKHLTNLTQVVGCCLKARREQNTCGLNAMISRSKLFGSANSTGAKEDEECGDGCFDGCVNDCFDGCVGHVDDSKEDGVGNSVESGDKHLTHLTQFENNDNLDGCDKHLTHLRGGGLKDDRDSIDNGQKDNYYKNNVTQTIKVLVR